MSTIQRRIEISGSDAGFGNTVSRLADELQRSFEGANEELERMTGNAQDFGEVLEGRMDAIEKSAQQAYSQMQRRLDQQRIFGTERVKQMREEVTQAERALRLETERGRLAERMRYQNQMRDLNDSGADNQEKSIATREHREKMASIREEETIRILQIRSLRGRVQNESSNSIGARGSQDDGSSGGGGYRGYSGIPGSGALRSITGGILSGLGIAGLFSIAGFIGKMLNEGIDLDNAESMTRGLGMKGIGGAPGLGKKRSEMLQYSREVVQAAGNADYRAINNLMFEKRFSQDENSLLGLTSGLRTEGRGRGASAVAVEMLNFFKRSDLFNVRRGDFSQLGEKIQFNTRMLDMQGAQMMQTNATTNSQILEAFGRSGIGDQRTMGFVDNINQNITSPNNDFSRAFIMRSLRARNPNMSLFELLKRQEQGIFGEGTFGQVLGDLQGTFSGDQLKMSIAQLFGLKNFQAEQIAGMSPEVAARIGSKEDINDYLQRSGEGVLSIESGAGGAGVMSRRMAELNDWFAGNGVKAIHKIDEYINTYEKQGFGGLSSKLISDVTDAIDKGFKKVYDYVKDEFTVQGIDKRLGLGEGVLGQDGKPLSGTTPSVGNVFDRGTFFGGGQEKQLQSWIDQGFDYNQSQIMPPALTTFQPIQSRRRGKDIVMMRGNNLAGNLKGKEIEADIPDNTYGQYTAAQIVQLFAFAVQNGLEKISLDQSKMIIEHGFQPSVEVLKQLQISNLPQNKTYSTEK